MGEWNGKKKYVKQMCSANLTLLKSNTSENTIPSEKVIVFMLWGCFLSAETWFRVKTKLLMDDTKYRAVPQEILLHSAQKMGTKNVNGFVIQ